jgi:cholesterol transport system auxiliary component
MKSILSRFWLMFALSACVMTPKQPALHDFGPVPGDSESAIQPIRKAVLSVDAPSWLWDNRIRYRLLYASPTKVGFYALDQWIGAPPELFQQRMMALGGAFPYALRIQLTEFEQQFNAADQARVVLSFAIDAFSADSKRKLASQAFHLEKPAKTPDAAGAVEAFGQLIRQAEANLETWLKTLPDQ